MHWVAMNKEFWKELGPHWSRENTGMPRMVVHSLNPAFRRERKRQVGFYEFKARLVMSQQGLHKETLSK